MARDSFFFMVNMEVEDLAAEMTEMASYGQLIRLVTLIDANMADTGFTIKLIDTLANAVREEGFTVTIEENV
jgi:hypothetical protein